MEVAIFILPSLPFTVKFQKIETPEQFVAVVILKFEQSGFT